MLLIRWARRSLSLPRSIATPGDVRGLVLAFAGIVALGNLRRKMLAWQVADFVLHEVPPPPRRRCAGGGSHRSRHFPPLPPPTLRLLGLRMRTLRSAPSFSPMESSLAKLTSLKLCLVLGIQHSTRLSGPA